MNTFGLVNSYLTMPDVARLLGYTPNKAGFIRSPFHDERTPSCKLYNEPGRGYCDFSSGDAGDCIRFTARVLQVNNWEACRYLVDAFHLPVDLHSNQKTASEIEQLQRKREAEAQKKKIEKKRWVRQVDELKTEIQKYDQVLANEHVKPLSWLWIEATNRNFFAEQRLNELCGVEELPHPDVHEWEKGEVVRL